MTDLFGEKDLNLKITELDKNNPFYEKRLCLIGNFSKPKREIIDKLKSMGANPKPKFDIDLDSQVDGTFNVLTRDTDFIILAGSMPDKYSDRLTLNNHDGYFPRILNEYDFAEILNGNWEKYKTFGKISKCLKLSKNHYFWNPPIVNDNTIQQRKKSPVEYDYSFAKCVLSGKEIYVPNNFTGNVNILRQIIANLGGYSNAILFPETEIIVLSNQSYNNLINQKPDVVLQEIENSYNKCSSPMFNVQFTNEKELLKWCEARCKAINDNLTLEMIEKFRNNG